MFVRHRNGLGAAVLAALLIAAGFTLLSVSPASAALVAYSNDFTAGMTGTPAAGVVASWSSTRRELSPDEGWHGEDWFTGRFGGGREHTQSLTLTNLPAHQSVNLSFELFVTETWEGNSGPDTWSARIDGGQILLNTTFANENTEFHGGRQAFPAAYPGGDNPATTKANEANSLGYVNIGRNLDTVYRFDNGLNASFTFAHTGSTLKIDFSDGHSDNYAEEGWGIDDVIVTIYTTTDTQPPSVPTNVQAVAPSPSTMQITWTASTDNIGVAGYKVFRNGGQVGLSGSTTYNDNGLTPNTTYSYTVSAYDVAGNYSVQSSPPATATTPLPGTWTTWLWQADNHSGTSGFYSSNWTDGAHVFTESRTSGGWYWSWDDPEPNYARLIGPGTATGRSWLQSNDFGEDWSADTGITVSARVKAVTASAWGDVMLSVNNSSTLDLASAEEPTAKSTHVWVGWDAGEQVVFVTRNNTVVKQFTSSVPFTGVWTIWTLAAQQIGSTIAWDLWINGVWQNKTAQASDGSYHTLVWSKGTDMGTSVVIGQRRSQGFAHDTIWDYVGVTNYGVVPGWSGISDPSTDSEPPSVPAGVQVAIQTPTTAKVTWGASTDNIGVTGYKVFRNGTLVGTRTTATFTDTGLSPNTAYSFTISAYDAAGNESPQSSPPATATTMTAIGISDAKKMGDSSQVGLVNKTVTAVFGDCFYIEEMDRHIGIKVVPLQMPGGIEGGKTVDIGGVMQTGSDGERQIGNATASLNSTGSVVPVGMTNKALGGGDWSYNLGNDAGQKGIKGASGANNIGLLVTIWGKATYAGSDHFYVNDGSNLDDGSGHLGVKVQANGLSIPAENSHVAVTGISSCYKNGSDLHRLILAGSIAPLD